MDRIQTEAFVREHSEGHSIPLKSPCARCQSETGEVIKMATGPHFAKICCYDCGLFVEWVAKPENEKRNRRKNTRLKPEIDYCQMCERTREELDGTAAIEEHHVLEVKDWPELDDDPDNRWVVCTRCHNHIHNIRLMVRGTGGKRKDSAG